ncbi:MAG: PilZ domain-containing protein [Chloroflexi bacterium]|nr:PilZ domain-containing protein [Chloroflexota bacterium]
MARTERRQKPRSGMNLLVALRSHERGNGWSGFARTLDLSESGALLETPDPFQVGQSLSIELLLNEDRVVEVNATIIRITAAQGTHRVALKFEQLEPHVQRLLARQVKS